MDEGFELGMRVGSFEGFMLGLADGCFVGIAVGFSVNGVKSTLRIQMTLVGSSVIENVSPISTSYSLSDRTPFVAVASTSVVPSPRVL